MESVVAPTPTKKVEENASSLAIEVQQSSVPGSKVNKNLVFRDIEQASDRL